MASTGFEKSKWTISLLHIQQEDNVLEIGFGPGVAIELVSDMIQGGRIVGIDYSNGMIQQARKRNKHAIEEVKVNLIHGDINNPPSIDFMFDKVFSINSIIFWEEPVKSLIEIRKMMKPNGLIALTIQPYMKGATEETSNNLAMTSLVT